MVSVMSHFVRHFDLMPGTQVKAVSVMGHATLDFRGAVGGPGIVEARCVAVMGSIEMIVPPIFTSRSRAPVSGDRSSRSSRRPA